MIFSTVAFCFLLYVLAPMCRINADITYLIVLHLYVVCSNTMGRYD